MINISTNRGNDTRCKRNPNDNSINPNVARKGRRFAFILDDGLSFPFGTRNKIFFMLFAIFGILIPIGVQPQIQANHAFAELNIQSTVNQIGDSIENTMSSPLPTVSTNSNSSTDTDTINPFDSEVEGENSNTKTDTVIPDIIGMDIVSENKSDSIYSNESHTPLYEYISDSIVRNDVDNMQISKDIVMAQSNRDGMNNFNLSFTEAPMTNFQNNSLAMKNNDRNPLTYDVPSSDNLEKAINSLSPNMSYPHDMKYSNPNIISQNLMIQKDREFKELDLMNLSVNPYISNESDVGNFVENDSPEGGNLNSVTDNQSEFTTSANSYHKYRSYSDFIDKNISNKNENNTHVSEEIIESESSSFVNNSSNYTTLQQIEANNDSIVQGYSSSAVSLSAQSGAEAYGDFNGDGKDDLAIGVPFEDVGSFRDAGAVQIIYGSSTGLSATTVRSDQFWSQDSPDVDGAAEQGDSFGRSLSSGDFNDDGLDDLAIGVPGENLGNIADSGVVEVIYGSPNGLSATSPRPDQFWTQDIIDVEDGVEADENFGSSLSMGDFNGDHIEDLAIGVPYEDIGTVREAGGVQVLYGSLKGLSATSPHPDQFLTQDNPDVDGTSETADYFGYSISSGDFNGDDIDDLAIGIPGEHVGNVGQAGAAQVIYGSLNGLSPVSHPDQFWTQESLDMENGAEYNDLFGSALSAGDYNGDGIDDLAIGVPAEGLGPLEGAGAIQAIYGSLNGLSATIVQADQFWTQDSPEIASASGPFKNFGVALSSGDFNGDGIDDLAIGVPGEDIGNLIETGAAQIMYGSSVGLSPTVSRPDQFWTQDTLDVNNGAEIGDLFGASLSAGDFDGNGMDDLVVGVSAEDLGSTQDAGAVQVLYGSSKGVSATFARPDQFWTQDTTDIAATAGESDGFGSALG